MYSAGTGNAGVRIYESSNCIIENNYFNVYGFGIEINPQGGVPCGNNIYRDNYIEGHYGLPGIALWPWDTEISSETFIRNIIARTDGTQGNSGHGIHLRTRGTASLKNIKIINNVINNAIKSGIYVEDGADVSNIVAKNNIIVNNGEYGIYGSILSSYNNLWSNTAGNYGGGASAGDGDISADPLFADPAGGDFHLKSEYGRWNGRGWVNDSETSPCIDAGDPSEKDPDGTRINMGAYGGTSEASRSASTLDNNSPVANAGGPYTGSEGSSIAFDGSASYDPDGSIVSYEWEFGDGTTDSGVSPTHTYLHDGTYTVTMTVIDDDGALDSDTTSAVITDLDPVAGFTALPRSGTAPLAVSFTDLSTSHDGISRWEWDFDGDGRVDSTAQNPIHVYDEGGTYTVSLTVHEADGDHDTETRLDYISVTSSNNPPYTPYNPSPGDHATGQSIDVDLAWSGGDPDGDSVTYDIYFGVSATPPLVSNDQSGTSYDPGTLEYNTTYHWRIVATDEHGASAVGAIWSFTTASPCEIYDTNGTPGIQKDELEDALEDYEAGKIDKAVLIAVFYCYLGV
ncbi:MAG: PKD domain-containing protein [Methanosarcinales archaeon]